jgi:probable F420-dependent oxidoreductase
VLKIILGGLQQWSLGDFRPVQDLVVAAERIGIDEVLVTDHVVMGENLQAYPYGDFPGGPEGAWFEPIVVLAAMAAVTRSIRLATGILIAPLRPAALLAKQLATLDVMSGGRIDIGVGVGWQKEEYDACGVPFENRFSRLEEQVRACKALWRDAPASFAGAHECFDRVYCRPAPLQSGGVPIWFGLAPTERNIQRMVELGDGWMPMEQEPEKLGEAIARIRAALVTAGRDPASFSVRGVLRVLERDGRPDLEASLAQAPALMAAGVTHLEVRPARFLPTPEGYEPLLERLVALRGSLG